MKEKDSLLFDIPEYIKCDYKDEFGGEYIDDILVAFNPSAENKSYTVKPGTTKIAAGVFINSKISSIVFPDSLSAIGVGSFNFTNLKKITFPHSLEYIAPHAFNSNEKLTDIVFSEGLKIIDVMGFYACENLKTINFPDSLTIIEEEAFALCERLKKVKFSKGIKKIASCAFAGCEKLQTIIFESPITEIDISEDAFAACDSLTEIITPNGTYSGNLTAFFNIYTEAALDNDYLKCIFHASEMNYNFEYIDDIQDYLERNLHVESKTTEKTKEDEEIELIDVCFKNHNGKDSHDIFSCIEYNNDVVKSCANYHQVFHNFVQRIDAYIEENFVKRLNWGLVYRDETSLGEIFRLAVWFDNDKATIINDLELHISKKFFINYYPLIGLDGCLDEFSTSELFSEMKYKTKSNPYNSRKNSSIPIIKYETISVNNDLYYRFYTIQSDVDEIGITNLNFKGIKKVKDVTIPNLFKNKTYTAVGQQYYTTEQITSCDCILFAETTNKYDRNAISIRRWYPHRRGDENVYPSKLYNYGYISKKQNAQLHDFMLENQSQILFAKVVNNKVQVIDGLQYLTDNEIDIPECIKDLID